VKTARESVTVSHFGHLDVKLAHGVELCASFV